jgi:membrane protease YdiL (CAAX protease family)
MEDSHPPLKTSRIPWIDRIQASVEVLLISGLVSGLFAALLMSLFRVKNLDLLPKNANLLSAYLLLESAITFLILAALLRLHGESFRSFGLRWESWKRKLLLGLTLVPIFFSINGVVIFVFRSYLSRYYSEHNPLVENLHTPQQLALFIFSALVAGGIKEEIQRAFILNRFRTHLGGAWAGLLLWSIAFGAGHYVQGAQGIVIASLYGFLFGVIYLRSGSLIAPLTAHAAYNTLAILAFWFLSGRVK